jgi:hypothetical protein
VYLDRLIEKFIVNTFVSLINFKSFPSNLKFKNRDQFTIFKNLKSNLQNFMGQFAIFENIEGAICNYKKFIMVNVKFWKV